MTGPAAQPPGLQRTADPAKGDEAARALIRALSANRLAPYRMATEPGLGAVLRLYRWDAAVAGALHEDLGVVEVVLRNALAGALQRRHERAGWDGGWWTDPERLLDTRDRAAVAAAVDGAERNRPVGGPVPAGLGFGFWRGLLNARYDCLWAPALREAFPHLPSRDREDARRRIVPLAELRNRVAHHEPVHGEDLHGAHAAAIAVVGFVCPVTARWMTATSRVPALLACRPDGPARLAA